MSLLYRYVDRPELLDKLSKLAREELLHFEQVIAYMRTQDIDYVHITPATYAASLRGCIATHEPWRLVDRSKRAPANAFIVLPKCLTTN